MACQMALQLHTVTCSTSYSTFDQGARRRGVATVARACMTDSMVRIDYHSILGVRRNASRNEVKWAYRNLTRQYHPDVCKERGCEKRFKQINRAYESVIKNHNYFQSEVGLDCNIEDFLKTVASKVVPDIFCIEDLFEGLDINNLSYYKTPFNHMRVWMRKFSIQKANT